MRLRREKGLPQSAPDHARHPCWAKASRAGAEACATLMHRSRGGRCFFLKRIAVPGAIAQRKSVKQLTTKS